ncbi:MAG: hypothetical protein GXP31_08500 [Kiritimatiellaeota bacterium]|nr:hypothetical protein [Kiritimatiellota bacterium]
MRTLRRLLEKHPEIGPVSLVLNLLLLTVLVAVSIAEGVTAWLTGAPGIRSATVESSAPDRTAIILKFNTAMPELAVPRHGTPPFVFTPRFAYSLYWKGARSVYVAPVKQLTPGRCFTVEPRRGLRDLNGRFLDPTPVKLTIPPVRVSEVGVPIRRDDENTQLQILFNAPLPEHAFGEHMRVESVGTGRLTKVAMNCIGSKGTVLLKHTPDLERIRLTLSPGLTAVGGTVPTSRPWVRELDIPRALVIREAVARTGYSDPNLRIAFKVNGALDCSSALSFIRVNPPVESLALVPGEIQGLYELRGDFRSYTVYRLRFASGLRTRGGRVLDAPILYTVVTSRGAMQLRFASSGLYLPKLGADTIAVRAAGIKEFQVTARRIYARNLVRLVVEPPCWETSPDRLGPARVLKVVSVPSAAASTARTFSLSMPELMGAAPPGVYLLQVKTKRAWSWSGPHRTRIVVWTRLTAAVVRGRGRSLAVWVRDMNDRSPVEGCDIEVLSERNLVLGRGRSGTGGLARVSLDQPSAAQDETPALVVFRKGPDLSLLPLNAEFARDEVASGSLGEKGYPESPYSAFVYAERDLCRPGESMRFAFLVRDRDLRTAGGFPVRFSITDPKGRPFLSRRLHLSTDGYASIDVAFPADARTGGYQAVVAGAALANAAYGRFSFFVLPYVPARLRLRLQADRPRYGADGKIGLTVAAHYYFGRPAADCRVDLVCALRPRVFAPPAFREFVFGFQDPDRTLPPPRNAGRLVTDAAGQAQTVLPVPTPSGWAAPLTMILTAVAHQPGGRTVAASVARPIDPTAFYLGVRREPPPAATGPGRREIFAWVCLSPAGRPRPLPAPIRFSLHRIVWRSTLRLNADAEYVRTWTEQVVAVTKGTVPAAPKATRGRFAVPCPAQGLWELRLRIGKAESRLRFAAGAMTATVRSAAGSAPVVTRDKPVYRPGETARLRFSTGAPGRLLLCLATNRVLDARVLPVNKGPNTISVRIPQTPFGCVYAALYLQTTPGPLKGVFRPGVRFGLTPLPVSQARYRLDVTLDAPETTRPGTSMRMAVRLESNHGPTAGRVDLFAVDAGILSLTGYAAPDPFSFYFGKRRCGIQVYDGLAHFYPDVSDLPRLGIGSEVGGDQMSGLLRDMPPDTTRRPAVSLLGVLDVPPSGKASVTVPVPDFNGALRFMAVAWAGSGVGGGERLVRVRDRVTVQATVPRAVAGGDEFDVTVHAVNNDLPETRCRFTLRLDGGPATTVGETTRNIVLPKHGEARFSFRLVAASDDNGQVRFTVHCFSESGAEIGIDTVEFAVRPAALAISLSGTTVADAGKQVRLRPPSRLSTETVRFSVHVSSGYSAAVMPALAWLEAYPYGCIEQTASKAFPFLYVRSTRPGALGAGQALRGDRALFAQTIRKAVRRIRRMQLPSGGFAMWPGSPEVRHGASLYAAHFLICCRDAGLGPETDVWTGLVSYMRAAAVNPPSRRSSRFRGYAHYLLARAGKAEPGLAEAFLKMKKDGDDSTGYILAATSLILAGRAHRGAKWLQELLDRPNWSRDSDHLLDTPASGMALAAIALEQAYPGSPALAGLMEALLRRRGTVNRRWATTFDNALAATALLRWQTLNPDAEQTRGTVSFNGGAATTVGAGEPFEYRTQTGTPAEFIVTNHGPGRLFAAWFARGVPRTQLLKPEYRGLEVHREYLSANGKPQRLFRRGDLVTVRIRLSGGRAYRNVVIVDLLPGGLEIENRAMLSNRTAGAVFTGKKPDYVEILEDRVLFFGALDEKGNTIRYACRAVSPGRFAAPPVAAYAMYAPDVYAQAPGGAAIRVRNQ